MNIRRRGDQMEIHTSDGLTAWAPAALSRPPDRPGTPPSDPESDNETRNRCPVVSGQGGVSHVNSDQD